MLPIQDLNPTRRLPLMTYGLIGVNVLVFLWEMSLSDVKLQRAFIDLAAVPANISAAPFSLETIMDIVRSMFFHGGYEHIFGNMLYLWLFGDNLEDRLGWILYLAFYFVCGFAATAAQVLIDPTSTIPMVGASGAIAGVLGGYLIMFPGVRVRGLVFFGYFGRIAELPALVVLGFWFVLQLFNGIASLGPETATGGVAFFAHIGGFIAGLALIFIFMQIMPQPPADQRRNLLYERVGRM
jgi:membrane associated rhomboid family serine protease